MKNYIYTLLVLLFSTSLMSQTETQEYQVLQELDGAEIRFYPPVMMAKFTSNGNGGGGFRYLFNYISGGNASQEKIAMTTPVHIETQERSSSMAFVLPKKFTPNNTPQPSGQAIEVYEAAAGHFAAFSYSGYTNFNKEQQATEKLMEVLKNKKIKVTGNPSVLVYNSPYKFYKRRNEIIIPIDPESL